MNSFLKHVIIFGVLAAGLFPRPASADEKIRIVATSGILASITRQVAGNESEIYQIASPNRDIHFISITPKDVLMTRKADVFVHSGMDLEIWRGPLLDASGRGEFISGTRAIDASRNIAAINVPADLSRLHGHIHAQGNPHYDLDPENAKIIADNIAEGLGKLYPEFADVFQSNAGAFKKDLDVKIRDWEKRLSIYKGAAVVSYHDTWPHFMKHFGLNVVGFLEPKPGIPPTAKHLAWLAEEMKKTNTKVIVKEIYCEKETPKKISEKTGAKVVTLLTAPKKEAGDYLEMVEYNVGEMEKAFKA